MVMIHIVSPLGFVGYAGILLIAFATYYAHNYAGIIIIGSDLVIVTSYLHISKIVGKVKSVQAFLNKI